MRTFGLLGYPLTHSFSKNYFSKKFPAEGIEDAHYENFSFPEAEAAVEHLRRLPDLNGFNITIPHKVAIMQHLDTADEVCQAIRSCNCIKVTNGLWKGFNTDVPGFLHSITPLLMPHHKKALVFGTGGASKAVVFALQKAGLEPTLVSRTRGSNIRSYADITQEVISNHQVLIDTTPVGMHPEVDECIAIPYEAISPAHLAYDLKYNPEKSLFLEKAEEQGAQIKNGYEMLILQAEESWRIWNDASL